MQEFSYLPYAISDYDIDRDIDTAEFARLQQIAETTEPSPAPTPLKAPPAEVDLSEYLHYIRMQTGGGCWNYSLNAVWDIMNEMECPYSPNLSMCLPLWVYRNKEKWHTAGGLFLPDGRFIKKDKVNDELHMIFGNTTEGTELTHHQWTAAWSFEGVNEATNYRLLSKPIPINVSSSEFMNSLAAGHPIRAKIPYHYVVIVGYDYTKQTFKYVNSNGDRWGDEGFAYYTFNQIDNKNPVTAADYIKIVPPRPVPAARISLKHSVNRLNMELWLSVEDSPIPKRKIWPHLQPMRLSDNHTEWDENSHNLTYTVRLPSELIWPPSPGNRLVLDLYDSGAFSETGGTLEEFSAAFGGHVIKCSELSNGSVNLMVHKHRRFYIP